MNEGASIVPATATAAMAAATAAPAWTLESIGTEAWKLEPLPGYLVRSILRSEAAELLDGLLARVARSRGALDVALGERLEALAEGEFVLRLGYSCIADYGREVLGMAGRTVQGMVRLGRELRDRPLLGEAVKRGEVSTRKALAVLPLARGEAEGLWVERARQETVRALEEAVRAERRRSAGACAEAGAEPGGEDDGEAGEDTVWERLVVPLEPEQRAKVEEAMDLAGKVLGAGAPRWQRLEALCQEFIGAHPAEAAEAEREERNIGGPFAVAVTTWLEPAKKALEVESNHWEWLEALPPVDAAGYLGGEGVDPYRAPRHLDGELRRLQGMRERWDELLGHLAMLVRMYSLWKDMGFASFGHYCAERLGMAERTVGQRIWLTRRFYDLPGLREAMREGKVSYEKARLVAGVADAGSLADWIDKAEGMTCIALAREIDAGQEAQACARGELALRVPERVGILVALAFRTARKAAGRWLPPEECLLRLAEHFVGTWKEAMRGRSTPHRTVRARDGGWCQVPGCSRVGGHAHHVLFRSHGGGDEPENLVAVCAAHHLHGLHRGFVRVRGRAPDDLVWELGERADC